MSQISSSEQPKVISRRPVVLPNDLRFELLRIERFLIEKKQRREREEKRQELQNLRRKGLARESTGRRLFRKLVNFTFVCSLLIGLVTLIEYLTTSQNSFVWGVWYDVLYFFPSEDVAGPF
jgi:hypothetical protein